MAARRQHLETAASRVSEEDDMRAIECPCGHHFEAADEEELFRLCRQHVDRDHPELERTDEQIRQRIAADAYDVQPVA
jgi:predicted small metal-binding protein